MESDFPEFDRAYKTVMIKDPTDRFEQLAAEANFNIYHSDIWRGTARRFAELIVRECVQNLDKNTVYKIICSDETPPKDNHWEGFVAENIVKILSDRMKQHFGVEPNVDENLRNRSTYFGNDI